MPPRKSRAAEPAPSEPDILLRAFQLVAEQGWDRFSMAALAREVGRPLADVYAVLPGRAALLSRLGERMDREMLSLDAAELADLSARERIFELIMRRLDAMAAFRAGLKAMAGSGGRDPGLICASLGNMQRLGGWLADAADLGSGLRACVGGATLLLLYARVASVWLSDETEDRSATMAELDRRLGQWERLASWTGRSRPSSAASSAAA
jgi:AcrR family transcriptional regulator